VAKWSYCGVTRTVDTAQHPKREYLAAAGALHAHPEVVRAELFVRNRFFDPLDKVQVKYEMLRAHVIDGQSVVSAATTFGCSRETFYQTLRSFEEHGLAGLRDEKPGRRHRLKLTDEDVAWVQQLARDQPELSGQAIANWLERERGVQVKRRTIERLLAGGSKKGRAVPRQTPVVRRLRSHRTG
jgi:transposase